MVLCQGAVISTAYHKGRLNSMCTHPDWSASPIWGPPIHRQQPTANGQQTDNYRQQVFLNRYLQINRDFYASYIKVRL